MSSKIPQRPSAAGVFGGHSGGGPGEHAGLTMFWGSITPIGVLGMLLGSVTSQNSIRAPSKNDCSQRSVVIARMSLSTTGLWKTSTLDAVDATFLTLAVRRGLPLGPVRIVFVSARSI